MDSGQDTRINWLVRGLAVLGIVGAGGIAVATEAQKHSPDQVRVPERLFNPAEGDIVRLQPGRGLQSEAIVRYPGERDLQTAVQKLLKAAGPLAGDQQNVDQFLPKAAPSKWQGEYVGFAEGSRISKGYKVDKVEPDKKQVILEVTANGVTDKITVSTDYAKPQNAPFSFKDDEGNTITIVAALGRKREEIKGGVSPDTVQIADRVVVHKNKA